MNGGYCGCIDLLVYFSPKSVQTFFLLLKKVYRNIALDLMMFVRSLK